MSCRLVDPVVRMVVRPALRDQVPEMVCVEGQCKVLLDQDFEFTLFLHAKETHDEWCHGYCQHFEAGRC